jgi:hypothetical protein
MTAKGIKYIPPEIIEKWEKLGGWELAIEFLKYGREFMILYATFKPEGKPFLEVHPKLHQILVGKGDTENEE